MTDVYKDYFDVDEEYFPQINDSSIAAAGGNFWTRTYPHETFIKMLTIMESLLSRDEMRSLWIEGAYGTGKSQCAYALKKILEVPDEELRNYWERYEPLRNKTNLLEKLIGHKQKGILTVHRYASGSISSLQSLFYAIQESVRLALALDKRKLYGGENTLKESVIAWIEKSANKRWLDDLLETDYSSLFSQTTADEILKDLRSSKVVKELMDNIFKLAEKEGITALDINTDRLLYWLTDIIDNNDGLKIVFVWDEFSDYFKNNSESLSEFQKLVELVSKKPFYFIVVTHEVGQLYAVADSTWNKVRDRFISINIHLPDNIAINLIGHAFNVKDVALEAWNKLAEDLNSRVSTSRDIVMQEARITNTQVIKEIMPLHPMAALLLNNIASAFKSNQRSMFDFIKSTTTEDVKAFQWFIENRGPLDNHPFLTVDMLWDFFYEKGKENLSVDIRQILDTYQQQQSLRDDEKSVLKAVLIMQAVDQRLGGTKDIFKATEQNISNIFEGITSGLDTSCKNIAKGLVKKGILVLSPLRGNNFVFKAAVLAGDQETIDRHKKDVLKISTTAKLVNEGNIASVLFLTPALRLRFDSEKQTGNITPVTITDFARIINELRNKPSNWRFNAVIAFAKDEQEAANFREIIKTKIADKSFQDIIFIDALSSPLGNESLNQYVDYSAMAMYYVSNNNQGARENANKAKSVLENDWKNRIYNGQFIIYTYKNQEGEKVGNGQGVLSILQSIVINKFPFLFDFNKGLSENQLKLTTGKISANCGITQTTSGIVRGIEKNILSSEWNNEKYWEKPSLMSSNISKIKIEVENLIEKAYIQDVRISIGDIYDFLEKKYGFAPSNLSAFLTGFLLKEYSGEPYRYGDSQGSNEPMVPDKLAEMIGNYIGKSPKPTYIVKMTSEEREFYNLTEKSWDITPNSCSSVAHAITSVSTKMRNFGLPVWCLTEVDSDNIFFMVQKFIELVQQEGKDAHSIAIEIGAASLQNPSIGKKLINLLKREKCQQGMLKFLESFEDGDILSIAKQIGAQDRLISDIRNLFSVKHSCFWDKEIGEDEIRGLLSDYGVIKESNLLLNVFSHTLLEAFNEWRNRLKFITISCDALKEKFPHLSFVLNNLLKIYQDSKILPDQMKSLHLEMISNFDDIRYMLDNDMAIFSELYAPYLENLITSDIGEIKSKLPMAMFGLSKTDSNSKVKEKAEEFRKNQLKTKLFKLWKDKTETNTPKDWSYIYKTPILCCVKESEFEEAKEVFETLNRTSSTDIEIKKGIAFVESTNIYDVLSDKTKRNEAFIKSIIGEYQYLLTDINLVRETLETLPVDPYDWLGSPSVDRRIKQLAEAEYYAGGSDKALSKIDKMTDEQLKKYLKRLVKNNLIVGIEIISSIEE